MDDFLGFIVYDSELPIAYFGLLYNAISIFACIDKKSDVKQEICNEDVGVWCESNALSDLTDLLNKISSDKSMFLPMKQKACEILIKNIMSKQKKSLSVHGF